MPARKRARQELDVDEPPPPPQEPTRLQRLRNTWEFASLMQYIYFFGSAVKIDEDVDIDELEAECLKPTPSEKLAQIGLALLKFVSSHKGLTLEIFDEYARRQFVAKAPQRNPFGVDETPVKFNDMDTLTKIRILQQLSTWTLNNAERIRERMPEKDADQTNWRIEAFGWDKDDRTYFVLDDDRLYRRTDPPSPAAPHKAKSNPKTKRPKGTRTSKRRRLSTTPAESAAEDEDETPQEAASQGEDTFGGMTWECVAVTLDDYSRFIDTIRKSRDLNEKQLVKRLGADVLPVIEKRAEQQRAKALRKQRELENLEKLAHAKRSTRIAGRMEKQKELEATAEAERRHYAELEMAKREQEKQHHMEEARQSRMMTREQRLKEREVKRILHEEELKKLEENSKRSESNEARLSERHLKAEMERRQKELEKMAQEEDTWIFDCAVCGVHGENIDDGSHSIACEKCNVWQHSACHGIAKEQAERDDFHFVCADCRRKAEDFERPKLPTLKFRVGASASPKSQTSTSPTLVAPPVDHMSIFNPVPTTAPVAHQPRPPSNGLLNGPSLSPRGQSSGPPGMHRPGSSHAGQTSIISPPRFVAGASSNQLTNGPVLPTPQYYSQPNGYSNPLSFPSRPASRDAAHGSPGQHRPPSSGYGAPSPMKPSSFNQQRPMSSGYGAPSPSKPAYMSSPYQSNGYTMAVPFSSPNTSFPPATGQQPSFSPVKQASSPPQQHSSPLQPYIDDASGLLPEPSTGISPEKHDGAPPQSSQGIAETPVLPPVAPLAPSADPPILTPPSKKTPEHRQTEPSSNTVAPVGTSVKTGPIASSGVHANQ